nr:collagen alpha-2(VIII) chain-like [Pan troglodytes]
MPAPDLSSEGGAGRATRPDGPSPSGRVGRALAIFRPWSRGSPGQPRRTREPSGACTCGFREPGGPRGAGARLTALRGSLGLRGRRPPVSLLKGGPGGIADSGLDRRLAAGAGGPGLPRPRLQGFGVPNRKIHRALSRAKPRRCSAAWRAGAETWKPGTRSTGSGVGAQPRVGGGPQARLPRSPWDGASEGTLRGVVPNGASAALHPS